MNTSPQSGSPARAAAQTRGRVRRGLRPLTAGVAAAGLLVTTAGMAVAANPPLGPGNIEIFAKRDMVAIDGYTAQAGETATISVLRGGKTVGIARGVVDPNGFLEVNHPGGACWDMVTPDIRGGDVVQVEFDTTEFTDSATVGTAVITDVTTVDMPATPTVAGDVEGQVVITGTYGEHVDTRMLAVEIVNPDMRGREGQPTQIRERAIGWPADTPPAGYRVDGVAEDGRFTVTFGFLSEYDRDLAFAGDPSVASWLAEPVGVEAQLGLTIYEAREMGGPGFGGCPAGPAGQAPAAPTDVVVTTGDGSITATWDAATVPPDANPVTSYQLVVEDPEFPGQEVSIRTSLTTATLQGLDNGKEYPVRVVASNGVDSAPAQAGTAVPGTATPPAEPVPGDGTEPALLAPGAPASVTVADGSALGEAVVGWAAPATGGTPAAYVVTAESATPDAVLPAPVEVADTATSVTLEGLTPGADYVFSVTARNDAGSSPVTATPATTLRVLLRPGAAHVVRVVPGNASAVVEWRAAKPGNAHSPVLGYTLTARPATGQPVVLEGIAGTATFAKLTGLTNGVTYAVELTATSAGGEGPAATYTAESMRRTTPTDQITAAASFRQRTREWRVVGTTSVAPGNRVTLTTGTTVLGTAVVQPDGTWVFRLRGAASPAPVGDSVTVTSSTGGTVTSPVTLR